MALSYNRVLLNSSSANSSTYTSNPCLITDWQQIAVQVPSLASAAGSRFTIWVSDADGTVAAIQEGEWVVFSSTTTATTVTPGHRWLRVTRSAVDSQASVLVNGASGW